MQREARQAATQAVVQAAFGGNGLDAPPKVLGDMIEALIGAVFLDSGYSFAATWAVSPALPWAHATVMQFAYLHAVCATFKLKSRDQWALPGISTIGCIKHSEAEHIESRSDTAQVQGDTSACMRIACLSSVCWSEDRKDLGQLWLCKQALSLHKALSWGTMAGNAILGPQRALIIVAVISRIHHSQNQNHDAAFKHP